MRYRVLVVTGLLFLSVHARASLDGASQALPVMDGRPAVAAVNGEPISLDELVMQLERPDRAKPLLDGYATAEDLEMLERLITVRLVVQEAATMGLADLPEIRKQVEVSSRQFLRDVLMDRIVGGVVADEAAIEKLFRELAKEWRTASLLFQDEQAARSAREEIAKGRDFDEVAARAIAAKQAQAENDAGYHRQKDYLPAIAVAVAGLEAGQVSPVLKIEAGFVIVKVVDVRYPESAEARAEARSAVVKQQQEKALKAHEEALKAEYSVVHKDVLDGLDYAAPEPGMDALLKDTRVVAEIKGASPLTVGDLTDYLRMQFFHGSERAGQGDRLNARKQAAFDATLGRRLLNMEALRLGIDKTAAYVDRINAFEDGLVFNAFVQKVIAPGSKMREEEIKAWYDGHRGDYAFPSMLRIRGLAFADRAAAEAAIEKLRAGTDFGWLAGTADHQVDKSAPGLLSFDGRPVTTDSMPEGLRKALADASTGDVRLYASPEGHFYALAVQEVVAPGAKPYDEVREQIARKLYGDKMNTGIEDYARKLRGLSKVEVFLKKAE